MVLGHNKHQSLILIKYNKKKTAQQAQKSEELKLNKSNSHNIKNHFEISY